MKHTTIPAGYRLTVTSWENDGDCYGNFIHAGLKREQVLFYVDFCKLMHTDKHGNIYEPSDEQIEEIRKDFIELLEKYTDMLYEAKDMLDDIHISEDGASEIADDCFQQMHCEFFGVGAEGFYTRALSSYKVEYIPEEIKFEDVTREFQ